MSTKKTEHYQLHAWEPGDDFLLREINENFGTLDSILKGKTEAVTGTYTGDGRESQLISLGFTPKVLLVTHESGGTNVSGYLYGGLVLPEAPAVYSSTAYLSIVEGGFRASRAYLTNPPNDYYANTNAQNTTYRYLAIP